MGCVGVAKAEQQTPLTRRQGTRSSVQISEVIGYEAKFDAQEVKLCKIHLPACLLVAL